jgi:hypothetical protein
MIKEGIEVHKVKVIEDIFCDSCGESCKVSEWKNSALNNINREFSYMKLSASWGYYSGKDFDNYEAHICEKCVDKHFKHINFTITNAMDKSIRRSHEEA